MDSMPMTNFLMTAVADHVLINRESEAVRLFPRPRPGALPNIYDGLCEGVEHLVRASDGTVSVSTTPLAFSVTFPSDYLVSGDPTLLYRVVRLHSALLHPNCFGGVICQGRAFRPGTRLRAVIHQLYWTLACQNFATESPLDPVASMYYLAHPEQIRALRARPLWRQRSARVVSRSVVSTPEGRA